MVAHREPAYPITPATTQQGDRRHRALSEWESKLPAGGASEPPQLAASGTMLRLAAPFGTHLVPTPPDCPCTPRREEVLLTP